MNVLSLLPLLKGWNYFPVDVDIPVSIPRGTVKTVQEVRGPAWIVAITAVVNNPDAEFVIEQEHPYGMFRFTARFRAFADAGLIAPTAVGFYSSRYDEEAGVYAVNYPPATPLGSSNLTRIKINAVDRDTVLLNYASQTVKVQDPEAFKASLREVLGGA